MTATDIEDAAALEAEALEHPDARGEILLEAAEAWIRGGRVERATELFAELIDEGGDDGCYARIHLARLLLGNGQVDAGYAELTSLAGEPALRGGHCGMVAEVLVECADLDGALRWYDRFVARMTPEEVEALRGPNGWAQLSSITLRGRLHVREELGLPADATDELVPMARLERPVSLLERLVAPLERPVAPPQRLVDLDDLRDRLDAGRTPPRRLHVLTFQRAERVEVRRRWPEDYPETDEEYYPAAERRWRALAQRGVPAIRVFPATVDGLVAFAERTGGSPMDDAVMSRYIDTTPEQQMLAWPPARNAPCWCGSGAKYKRCCGRAG